MLKALGAALAAVLVATPAAATVYSISTKGAADIIYAQGIPEFLEVTFYFDKITANTGDEIDVHVTMTEPFSWRRSDYFSVGIDVIPVNYPHFYPFEVPADTTEFNFVDGTTSDNFAGYGKTSGKPVVSIDMIFHPKESWAGHPVTLQSSSGVIFATAPETSTRTMFLIGALIMMVVSWSRSQSIRPTKYAL